VVAEFVAHAWDQLVGRLSGSLSLRFLLQPLMATILAVRAGIRDARADRPPFLWTVITDAGQRRTLLRGGWQDVTRLFTVAVVVDILYQVDQLHYFHPLQALLVAGTLAIVPYAVIRGLVTRVMAAFRRRSHA
jgi:hypothetical protein